MFKRIDNQDMIQQKLNDGNIKRYVKGRLLGKGGFAKCYEVISLQTEKKYAAKVIEKASLEKSKAKEKLTSEIKIHKSLEHPYVVHFEHYFEDSEFVYILLEKCPNQTLNELLKRRKRLTDIQTKYYVRQLALAIKYIHEEQIIHRDLKLGNLFLSEKLEIKIGDFGLATKLSHSGERKKTKCGTPNYIAPQILDDKKTHSFEVDVWSMGVITYALLVGKPPFETNEVKDTYNRIKNCHYSFPDSAGVPEMAKSFISKMLQLDPCKRATIDQILADPFLAQSTIPALLPISSLACPPSFDFLKKYRDLEAKQSRPSNSKNAAQILEKSETIEREQEKKYDNSSKYMSQERNQVLKPINRVNSVQKSFKPPARVFSAVNLLGNNTKSATIKPKKTNNDLANKALKTWVTYFEQNPKFGISYLLNSNAAGFRYNDYTAMISNCKMSMVKYIDYDPNLKKMKQEQGIIYKAAEAQTKETKKYKILTHFHKQLMRTKTQTQNQMQNELRIRIQQAKFRQTPQNSMKCFVIRYHRTSKCTMFWFSINAIQIIFADGSQILINGHPDQGVITYVNKYHERVHFYQKDQELQPDQIKKRLYHFLTFIKSIKKDQQNENKDKKNKPLQKINENKSEVCSMSRCNSIKLVTTTHQTNPSTSRALKTSSSNTNIMRNKKSSSRIN